MGRNLSGDGREKWDQLPFISPIQPDDFGGSGRFD
jgi:hypothetical protein